MTLKTNRDQLVMTAVQGSVSPANQWAPFEVGSEGEVFAWPSTGGITYNVKVGDSVFGWAGEHIDRESLPLWIIKTKRHPPVISSYPAAETRHVSSQERQKVRWVPL